MDRHNSFQPGDTIHVIKATRADGRSFHVGDAGTIDYAASIGKEIEVDAAPYSKGQCGPGLHVSPTAIAACRACQTIEGSRSHRPWRFFELAVQVEDIVWPKLAQLHQEQKWRVRRLKVVRELDHSDPLVFGENIARRVQAVKEVVAGWKGVRWLKPTRVLEDAEVVALVNQWRERVSVYLPANRKALPVSVRIVRTAAAAAAAADAALYRLWRSWWWYTRPYYVMRRQAWWALGGLPEDANPSTPMVKLYELGCAPIGFLRGEFVVYVPQVAP